MSNESGTVQDSPITREKMVELLHDFKYVMLTTRSEDGKSMRSRPMTIAKIENNGDLWFITKTECAVTDETNKRCEVNVCAQESNKYLSLSGTAHIIEDRDMVKQLWKDEWEKWIPLKYNDPNVRLIKLDARYGEYWDYSGLGSKLQFAFDTIKSAITREERGAEYKGEHEKVAFTPETKS